MAPVTEVIIIDASAAFKGPGILTLALDIASQAESGRCPAYYGLQIENGATGYLFLHWNTCETYQALDKAPYCSDVVGKLTSCMQADGQSNVFHVEFSAPPNAAFEKPVTEVGVLTLKAPENGAAVAEILSMLSDMSGKTLVFGPTHEDRDKYVLVGGWEAVEEHLEIVRKPEAAAGLDKLFSLVDLNHLYHTRLSQYAV